MVPFGLKLTIHDRTRIEWIATAPIAHEGKPNQYTIDFEVDVPDHLWRRHKLWQSFRARSRLQSPDSRTYPFQMRSILDEIRHELGHPQSAPVDEPGEPRKLLGGDALFGSARRPPTRAALAPAATLASIATRL